MSNFFGFGNIFASRNPLATQTGNLLGSASATPGVAVANTNPQSIPDSANTKVTFDTEIYDFGNMFVMSLHNDRITITQPGRYMVFGQCYLANNGTGTRQFAISQLNAMNVAVSQIFTYDDGSATSQFVKNISGLFTCKMGDYFIMTILQTSGGPLTLSALSPTVELGAQWIGNNKVG